MKVEMLQRLELKPGEHIVSMVPHRDYLVAITNHGTIYKIYPEEGL